MVALSELYVLTGELEPRLLEEFRQCMDIRELADYGLEFHPDSARSCIERAAGLLERAQALAAPGSASKAGE